MSVLRHLLRIFDALSMPRVARVLLRAWLRLCARDAQAALELMSRASAAGDVPALRSACLCVLALQPAHRPALDELARCAMLEGNHALALDLYRRIDALQTGDRPEVRMYESAYMDAARAARAEPYIATLRDVVLETDQCAIFDGDKVYFRETSGRNFANHPYVQGRASPDLRFFAVSCPAPVSVIEEPFVLIGSDGGTNYSHWISRSVLKLALLELENIPRGLPLLLNHDLRGYQLEYLDLLGIPQSRLMPMRMGEVIRCREILVPTLLRNHPRMRVGIDWLRGRVAHLLSPPDTVQDLLFISRRDALHRVLLNEAEIEDALVRLGFKTVVLGGMSVADQIRSFSKAQVIVGAHGAGLTNLMFAPPGAAVVEISNTTIYHMADFKFISAQMGQRYAEVVSGWYPENHSTVLDQRSDYLVDAKQVMLALQDVAPGIFSR